MTLVKEKIWLLARWILFAISAATLIHMWYAHPLSPRGEAKGTAQAIQIAEKSYFEEHKTYTKKLSDAGYDPKFTIDSRISIYVDSIEIPEGLRAKIPNDFLPKVESEHFQFLITYACDSAPIRCLLSVSENGIRQNVIRE